MTTTSIVAWRSLAIAVLIALPLMQEVCAQTMPLYLQCDQLIYDTRNNRIIAQGNVEMQFNAYELTAEQVIYDQAVNTLTAEGGAELKEPNGHITRADRFRMSNEFRDAFATLAAANR